MTSPRMAKLGWAEEVFYRRILSVVDDFGRYYADPGMLRAACYPRQLSKVTDPDIGKWLQVIAAAGLVRVYPALDGESYLEVLNFGQQMRAKHSKYPDPVSTCVADAQQPLANAHLDVSVSVSVEKTSSPAATDCFEEFWQAYPRKVGKLAAIKAFSKHNPPIAQVLRAIETQAKSEAWRKDGGQFIPHPSTWLNEGRWQDEGVVLLAAPTPKPSGWLEQQAEHARLVEADRIARKQREAA